MSEYRKLPVVINAMQWDGTAACVTEIIDWALGCGSIITYSCDNSEECHEGIGCHQLAIPTLEGRMFATVGDYIIKGVNGEFYPCKPEIFEKTYEAV